MSMILSKKQFVINCSVYYLNFSISSKHWFVASALWLMS